MGRSPRGGVKQKIEMQCDIIRSALREKFGLDLASKSAMLLWFDSCPRTTPRAVFFSSPRSLLPRLDFSKNIANCSWVGWPSFGIDHRPGFSPLASPFSVLRL